MDDITAAFKKIDEEWKGFTPLKQSRLYRFFHPARALHERNLYNQEMNKKHFQNKVHYLKHIDYYRKKRKERYDLTGE